MGGWGGADLEGSARFLKLDPRTPYAPTLAKSCLAPMLGGNRASDAPAYRGARPPWDVGGLRGGDGARRYFGRPPASSRKKGARRSSDRKPPARSRIGGGGGGWGAEGPASENGGRLPINLGESAKALTGRTSHKSTPKTKWARNPSAPSALALVLYTSPLSLVASYQYDGLRGISSGRPF